MKKCPRCGGELKDTAKFCKYCGANIKELEEKSVKFCSECGAELDGGDFCSECGAPVSDDEKFTEVAEVKTEEYASFDSLEALLDGEIAKTDKEKGLSSFEYYEHSDGTVTITALKDKLALSLVIPKGTVAIGEGALKGSRAFTISLPEGLLLIDKEAFVGCSELVKINLPSTLLKVGERAFLGCEKLDLTIPENVQVGDNAFSDTAYFRRVERERLEKERLEAERIEREKARAEAERVRLEKERLEKERLEAERLEAERLERQRKAIEQLASLCEIKYGDDGYSFKILKLKLGGRERISKLYELVIPEGCTEIGESVFEGCSFKSVVFPKTLDTIGRWAFYNCHYIERLEIPDGVFVGPSAFHRCESLSSVKFKGECCLSFYAFDNCRVLSSVDLGKCTSIGDSAFTGCVSLKSIDVPSTVSSIGNNAFRGCPIKSVKLHNLCKIYETTFPEGCEIIRK